MMVELHTMNDYISILKSNGLEIIRSEDISKNYAKTWDISLKIIKTKCSEIGIKNGNHTEEDRADKAPFLFHDTIRQNARPEPNLKD